MKIRKVSRATCSRNKDQFQEDYRDTTPKKIPEFPGIYALEVQERSILKYETFVLENPEKLFQKQPR